MSCMSWAGSAVASEEIMRNCTACAKKHQPRAEPVIPSSLPEYPWQKVATDLMQYKNTMFESHLRYSDELWGNLSNTKLKHIQCLETRAKTLIENCRLKHGLSVIGCQSQI